VRGKDICGTASGARLSKTVWRLTRALRTWWRFCSDEWRAFCGDECTPFIAAGTVWVRWTMAAALQLRRPARRFCRAGEVVACF